MTCWDAITAIGTAVIALATLGAAAAAWCAAREAGRTVSIAKKQMEDDLQWRKLDRAYSHSPYLSETFQRAIREIDQKFPGWEECDQGYTYQQITNVLDNDPTFKREFRTVLNHWGRMASEVERGLVDSSVVEELAKLNYSRFYRAFEKYINDGKNKSYYKYMICLSTKWK